MARLIAIQSIVQIEQHTLIPVDVDIRVFHRLFQDVLYFFRLWEGCVH